MREKSDGVAATARARRRLSGSVFLGHVSVGGRSRARRTHTLIGCPQCTWQGRPLKWEDADEEAVSEEEEEEETDDEGEEESKKSPENLVPV